MSSGLRITNLAELERLARRDADYLELARNAVENLGGRRGGSLESCMQYLRMNAMETSEAGVVEEINFVANY